MTAEKSIELVSHAQTFIDGCNYGAIKIALDVALDALEKQIPKKLISEGNDESDWVHCPCCDEILGVNEGAYNSFCDNNWNPIYCHKCGQAIIWK
jgi:hypothetical protein